jgi:DNA repair protein RecN (Recombination protein N)
MLIELRLRDFALADALSFEPGTGLVAVTGETGAGKSLLVNALAFATGDRAQAEYIRSGADRCEVAAVFEVAEPEILREWAEDSESTLVLRRELSAGGRGRAWINDRPVPVSALRRVGQLLCDLHSQHQHQWLLSPEHHAEYLDRFVEQEVLTGYQCAFDRWSQCVQELEEHRGKLESQLKHRDLWEFQKTEFDRIAPRAGEYEELESLRARLKLEGGRWELLQWIASELGGADESLIPRLVRILNRLESSGQAGDEACAAHLRQALVSLEAAESLVERAGLSPEESESSLEDVERRLHALYGLKKKFGGSLEAAITERDRIVENLLFLDQADVETRRLSRAEQAARAELDASGRALAEARVRAAGSLRSALRRPLADLGLGTDPVTVSQTPLEPLTWTREGPSRVEFMLQANPGEAPKALARIASGGELSRIMLGLKSVLPGSLKVRTLVFDEIDAGIGGETAVGVGKSLEALARGRQVIVITHLHQIAARADGHFEVRKATRRGRHVPEIRRLGTTEREAALARLIAGDRAGDAARKAAQSILRSGRSD